MHVVSRKKLLQFWEKHKDAEDALKEHANWRTTSDIKARYGSADFIQGNRVVFNVKGNQFRLVVKVEYQAQVVFIRFVGTHKEYSRIDAETI
jgi:mRNA interferase HigB